MPKSKEYVDDTDDSSSDEKEVKPKKKREAEEKEEKVAKKAKKESRESENEDGTWDLGNNRKVMVREFKGKLLVDIREMYFDDKGDLKPGKKGIALNMPQWRKLMSVIDDIDRSIKTKG